MGAGSNAGPHFRCANALRLLAQRELRCASASSFPFGEGWISCSRSARLLRGAAAVSLVRPASIAAASAASRRSIRFRSIGRGRVNRALTIAVISADCWIERWSDDHGPRLPNCASDHAELVRLVRRLASMIEAAAAPSQLELFDLRRQLTSTLIAHLKSEDWVLYRGCSASATNGSRPTARAFNDEMGGLAGGLCQRTRNNGARPRSRPIGRAIAPPAAAIIDALTNRIVRENRELCRCSTGSTAPPDPSHERAAPSFAATRPDTKAKFAR